MGDAVSRIVYVRLFLRPEALREFEGVLSEHRAAVSARDGFLGLRRLVPESGGHPNQVVLLLDFVTEEQLRAWRASDEHAAVAAKYRRLWARDPQTEFFSAEE
jgi:heme-degrading monooxygenase HmoA